MTYLLEALRLLGTGEFWWGPGGCGVRLVEHIGVSLLAVFIAALVGIPLGILAAHLPGATAVVGGLVGAMRALPILGLVVVAGLIFGVGLVAPIVVLVILAVPSLVTAGSAAVLATPEDIRDAATAVGFSRLQVVLQVIVPHSAGVLWAGVRTALVQVVATGTLAAYTSPVGLGAPIFLGLKTRDYPLMVAAACLVMLVTWVLDALAGIAQRRLS
ncbi:ABC transporter permease subunit [Corynebacterium uropygiale]|uniref:ABC transporter permease subunit n=1 Tax=Corynebacterium uropygiale TaxID=1775911 RepID=A0A9X1QRD8_9CORY|nr:ABC transporter permease subunit [Corynebacterium uropygiale]MCF4006790.1 ABC transporter permease subunit [Corynebacterium uropygiale]